MAEFCKQCSERLFGEDMKDFAGLCKEGEMVKVLCEGCGYIWVDHNGNFISGVDVWDVPTGKSEK